ISRIARGRTSAATAGRAASSTSKTPTSPPAPSRPSSSSAVATPERRLAPLWLATTRQPAARAHPETRRAVVVLPLVAEIASAPWPRPAASSPRASGRMRRRSLPGRLVPPPRPSRRESEPAARAMSTGADAVTAGIVAAAPSAAPAGRRTRQLRLPPPIRSLWAVEVAPGIALVDTLLGGQEGVTAAYLVAGPSPALVETGAQTSAPAVRAALERAGLAPADLAWLVLTHIHLDH